MDENGDEIHINYIGDLAISPPDNVLMVEQDADFVRACNELSNRVKSNTALNLWVRSKNHEAWLRDFTEQIGCACIFEPKTPRLVLSERWNVDLPDWLTDSEVLAHRLLEIEVAPKTRTSFETRFLVHFIGDIFETDTLSNTDLIPIINALVSQDAKALFKERPLLKLCLKAKCTQWSASSGREAWVKEFCKRLQEDIIQVWQWLSLWSGLHGYPGKLLEYVLAPEQIIFVRKIPPDAVNNLSFEPTAREQILNQIELFLTDIQAQINSSKEFQKVLGWTSGKLFKEYQLVSSILKYKQFAPTEADIQEVREKFKSCPGVSEAQLSSLIYLVKPSRPTLLEPEKEWNLTEWIKWTAEEYTPYRNWQLHNGHYDGGLEQTVISFSDWYIREYASIHKDPYFSMTHCLNSISSKESAHEFTVILIIDCLPIFIMEILDKALHNVDLNRHSLNYRFAGLPTTTGYNKAALLSGEWQDKTGNYEALLKARAASDWNGINVIYLNSLKALSEMTVPQEATIAVLNLIDGDELLHSDVESKGTTYEDELSRVFTRMAEAINRIAQEWGGSKENVIVYVMTDHGACRILEEEKRSFDSMVIKKLFANEKHRFATVYDEQVNEVPQNLWEIGYRFKRPFASEKTTFFLPKGHNTVRNVGAVKGYMHGGVTPEEVIVPIASYKLLKAAWKPLGIRFLNLDLAKETGRAKFYIQRIVTLEIEIQNPNATDVHILRSTITSPEADIKNCETITVPSGSVKALQMSCYFKKTALGEKPLEVEISYEIAGEMHTLQLALNSEFKSAVTGGFSLKDL